MSQARRYDYFKSNIFKQFEQCKTVVITFANNVKGVKFQLFKVDLSEIIDIITYNKIETLFILQRQTSPFFLPNNDDPKEGNIYKINDEYKEAGVIVKSLSLLASFSKLTYNNEWLNMIQFWKPCIQAIIKYFKVRYPHAKVEYTNYYRSPAVQHPEAVGQC